MLLTPLTKIFFAWQLSRFFIVKLMDDNCARIFFNSSLISLKNYHIACNAVIAMLSDDVDFLIDENIFYNVIQ